MTMQSMPGTSIIIPQYPRAMNTITTFNNANESNVMNAATHRNAFIFACPQAGDISALHVMFWTVTTGDDIRYSLQALNTSTGDPDGTELAFRVQTVGGGDAGNRISTGILSDDGTDTGALVTVTKGQKIALVLEFDSWVAGNMKLATGLLDSGWIGYPAVKEGVSWSEASVVPTIALEYDSDGIVPISGCFPIDDFANLSIGLNTTPDEVGSKFSLPFPARAVGVVCPGFDAGDMTVQIENAGGTIISGPHEYHFEPNDTNTAGEKTIYFDSILDLAKDTVYYFVITGTGIVTGTVKSLVITSGMNAAYPGGDWVFVERTDGGAWTEDETSKLMFALICDGFDDAVGGGGGDTIIPRIQMAGDSGPIPVY